MERRGPSRGTGCSGGAFDFFEPLQSPDGYDVIETIARQPWALHHKVGMMGISYGGISQLFTAQTRPPSLEAISPLSVLDATATTLYPGGVLNNGFAVAWAQETAAAEQSVAVLPYFPLLSFLADRRAPHRSSWVVWPVPDHPDRDRQIIAAMVTPQAAEAVEHAVNAGSGGTVEIDTEDGRIAIVVPRVMYLKRFTKGSQPGFAAD